MKVLFLDIDGVLNSYQSAHFWHNKRDQSKWENEMFEAWQGTLYEYLAQEFCPIALSNLEELMRRVPDLKIVVSSTWRIGETVESLKQIFKPAKLVADAIIGKTPAFKSVPRGLEIEAWLETNPEVSSYVILDDDGDMAHLVDRLVQTDAQNGFMYTDLIKVVRMLSGEGEEDYEHCII